MGLGFRVSGLEMREQGLGARISRLEGCICNYLTEMCSGSEAGSYLRRIDFVYHSTLGLRVIKKKKKMAEADTHQIGGGVQRGR